MNHTTQYRTTLPHQIHQTQCPPLQTFTARFPATALDSLNAVMIPTITPDETGQYHGHMAQFMTENRPTEQQQPQQHIKEQAQQPPQQGSGSNECERNDTNCPTTSGQSTTDFGQPICSHGVKNCLQCYNKTQGQSSQTNTRNKIMVDVATMTDCDEMDLTPNWQNVSVPANTKVAEYLTSLRQFLKMDRRFVCSVCGLGHARREQLERHQLSHSQERKHVCPACQKRFKRNEHLARHVITHSGLKPHGCLECGKAFYRKDHLRKHLLAHETKRIRLAAGLTSSGGSGGVGAVAGTGAGAVESGSVSGVKSLSLSLP